MVAAPVVEADALLILVPLATAVVHERSAGRTAARDISYAEEP